jgi:hypothetical protein
VDLVTGILGIFLAFIFFNCLNFLSPVHLNSQLPEMLLAPHVLVPYVASQFHILIPMADSRGKLTLYSLCSCHSPQSTYQYSSPQTNPYSKPPTNTPLTVQILFNASKKLGLSFAPQPRNPIIEITPSILTASGLCVIPLLQARDSRPLPSTSTLQLSRPNQAHPCNEAHDPHLTSSTAPPSSLSSS